MTSQGPDPRFRGDDAWTAALGDVIDPANPKVGGEYEFAPRPRRWPRTVRRVILVLIVLAGIGGGTYAFLGHNKKTPDAGAPVTVGPLPGASSSAGSGTPSTSSTAPPPADTAAANQLQLKLATTEETSWAQLTPFLTNLAKEGVSQACANVTSTNESSCRFGAKPASHHAVLIGDATALNYLPAILAGLEPHGYDVQVLTLTNCPTARVAITVDGVLQSACDDHHTFVSQQIAAIKPSLIISSDAEVDFEYATPPPKPKGKPREKPDVAYTSGLTSAVEDYSKIGKVVVVSPAPGAKHIADCKTVPTAPAKGCLASIGSSWTDFKATQINAVSKYASYLDTSKLLCYYPTTAGSVPKCPAIVGVTPVYVDGAILTQAYSSSLGFAFAPYAAK